MNVEVAAALATLAAHAHEFLSPCGRAAYRGSRRLSLASLPESVLLDILTRLEADDRMLLSVACTRLRALVNTPSLWTECTMALSSLADGSTLVICDEFLALCSAKAAGGMTRLVLDGTPVRFEKKQPHAKLAANTLSSEQVLSAVRANGGSLTVISLADCQEDRASTGLPSSFVQSLLDAAPRLASLDVDVECKTLSDALALLSRPPLRVHDLHVCCVQCAGRPRHHAPPLRALFAAVAAQPSLKHLSLDDFMLTSAQLGALVDAVNSARVEGLNLMVEFSDNHPSDDEEDDPLALAAAAEVGHSGFATAPHLARLVAPRADGSALTQLTIYNVYAQLQFTPELCDALASSRITHLSFGAIGLWDDIPNALCLMDALHAHPVITDLRLEIEMVNDEDDVPVIAASFARLLSAHTLTFFSIEDMDLGDALVPVFEAVGTAKGLEGFNCGDNATESERGFSDRGAAALLAAARACASLKELTACREWGDMPDVVTSVAVAAARA